MNYKDFGSHFQKLCKLGEGSYGEVFLCSKKQPSHATEQNYLSKQNYQPNINSNSQNLAKKTNNSKTQFVALKKLKMRTNKPYSYYEEEKQPNVEDLGEVQIMKCLNHENLIPFSQILVQDKGYKKNYYLILPFGVQILEFAKQKEVILTKSLRKTVIYQIVNGLKQLHSQNILHRDVKSDNIFLMKNGTIQIGDFSLSRKIPEIKQSLNEIQNQEQQVKLSGNVTTRYYRAPQIMYGSRHYGKQIDIWSLGCTIAQLILHQPLFPGQTDINQLELIFKTIGYPQQHWQKANQLPYYLEFVKDQQEKKLRNVLPDIQSELLDLIESCLQLDPEKRALIDELCQHIYFADAQPKLFELEKLSIYLHEKKIKQLLTKKH